MLVAGLLTEVGNSGTKRQSQEVDQVLSKRKSFCPGPETEPKERQEPGLKEFAEQLSDEVASLDANKVHLSGLPPISMLLAMLQNC